MYLIKEAFHKAKHNLGVHLLISSLIQISVFFLLKNITFFIFDMALKNAYLEGINNENFSVVFSHPLSVILLILCLISLGLVSIWQTMAILSIGSSTFSIKNIVTPFKRIRGKDIPSLILYTLILLPLTNIGILTIIASNLQIPSFIVETLKGNVVWYGLYLGIFVLLSYLSIRYFYTFIIFYGNQTSFRDSMRKSYNFTKGKVLKVLSYILISIGITVGISFIGGIIIMVYRFIHHLLPFNSHLMLSIVASFIAIISIVASAIGKLMLVQFTILSYPDNHLPQGKHYKLNFNLISNLVLVGLFIMFTINNYYTKVNVQQIEDIEIIAHRGVKYESIENTVSSLVEAKDLDVRYVEMDVEELKDGTLIVYHDSKFNRLTSHNVGVKDVGWDEVKNYELKYKGLEDSIPTLEQYLEKAKDINQPILLEIKVNKGDSEAFVSNVLKQVQDSGMSDHVIYQSLSQDVVNEIKKIDSNAVVGYILGLNVGKLPAMNVDFYSIEASSVTSSIIKQANQSNINVYEWTINGSENIKKAFSKDIKGIITDDVIIAFEIKDELVNDPLAQLIWWLDQK